LDNQAISKTHPAFFIQVKVSQLKMRCPNFKRGCKEEMLAGKEFQNLSSHLKVFLSFFS
jgi:hypothetical protein